MNVLVAIEALVYVLYALVKSSLCLFLWSFVSLFLCSALKLFVHIHVHMEHKIKSIEWQANM